VNDSVHRLAVISLHTSPLAQPGGGDGGGMNVYVAGMVAALARAGVDCTVFTRRDSIGQPTRVHVDPGFDVVHVDAGPLDLPKDELPAVIDDFTAALAAHPDVRGADAIHAHYWLSGEVGHRLKHDLGIPLVVSFHTLGRVKVGAGDVESADRISREQRIVQCADALVANAPPERDQLATLYGADPSRIEIINPGVDHTLFSPGSRAAARRATGLGDGPVLLFVGRIQPLKGVDVAIEALARLDRSDAVLVVIGGPSGADGETHLRDVRRLAADLGVAGQVVWQPPKARHALSTWYRAADIVVVPSRSESFGLVALEAAACGVPVVATAVGGLRTVVVDGATGLLVHRRTAGAFAEAISGLLADPARAAALGAEAAVHAREFTWARAAARLRQAMGELRLGALVDCR
jgi:D-inositol-3-phosphate glycosyltransferase